MRKFHYLTSCVNSTADAINEMTDQARTITYNTISRHIDIKEANDLLGYSLGCKPTLKTDWSVTFHKSKYQGQECYYIQHSRIEYIFVKD